jgi:prepilin peptidase CpaA
MFAVLLWWSTWAVRADLLAHRIPNLLTGSLLLVGLVLQAASGGPSALGQAALGVLVGLAILMPLYILRATGAGDVKFLAAAGALLGPYWAALAGAYTLIGGGALALSYVACRAMSAAMEPTGAPWPLRVHYACERARQARRERFPYAVAIAAGALGAAIQRGDLQVAFDYLTGVAA